MGREEISLFDNPANTKLQNLFYQSNYVADTPEYKGIYPNCVLEDTVTISNKRQIKPTNQVCQLVMFPVCMCQESTYLEVNVKSRGEI